MGRVLHLDEWHASAGGEPSTGAWTAPGDVRSSQRVRRGERLARRDAPHSHARRSTAVEHAYATSAGPKGGAEAPVLTTRTSDGSHRLFRPTAIMPRRATPTLSPGTGSAGAFWYRCDQRWPAQIRPSPGRPLTRCIGSPRTGNGHRAPGARRQRNYGAGDCHGGLTRRRRAAVPPMQGGTAVRVLEVVAEGVSTNGKPPAS